MKVNSEFENRFGPGCCFSQDSMEVINIDVRGSNQEFYYTIRYEDARYIVGKNSRGIENAIFDFDKEISAYFYLNLIISQYSCSHFGKISHMYRETDEKRLRSLIKTVSIYVLPRYFNIMSFKNDTVCIIKEGDTYSIYYVGIDGIRYPIDLNITSIEMVW